MATPRRDSMSATDSALLLRAIEQSGNQTLEALERTQVAQRDGFRAMADAVRDLGATLQRQIEQQAKIESARATTAAPRETNWSLLIGLGGLLVAMIVPLYAWQGETARHTQEMADQLGDRMELMRENVVKNAAQLGALVRDHREVETQFDAQLDGDGYRTAAPRPDQRTAVERAA